VNAGAAGGGAPGRRDEAGGPGLVDILRLDIASFADTGSLVDIRRFDEERVKATWQYRGEERSASFLLRGPVDFSQVEVRDGSATVSYRVFVANIADLRAVARNLQNWLVEPASYVAPHAHVEDDGRDETRNPADEAHDLLRASVLRTSDRTKLIFVTAGAGVGKTYLLERAVRESARLYREGSTATLWMYVNAQGRRLARLDDAVAGDLDRVRATFPFEAISTLVRVGAIVLVVDGFDELLGIAGSYDEAFSSLASFLAELQGAGSVVAAARSSYYDQEFSARVGRQTGFRTESWDLVRLRLHEWTVAQAREYVASRAIADGRRGAQVAELQERVESIFSHPEVEDLAGKPFFVTRATDILLERAELAGGVHLLEQLINSYLERESRLKLIERRGRSYLSADQLREIFAEVAEEMWRQNTRELSSTTLRELLGVLVGEIPGLDSETQLAVLDRGPHSAVLRSGDAAGSVAFEHDVYYAYFLAGPIVDLARKGDVIRVRQALRRGRLPLEAGDLAGRRLGERTPDVLTLLLDACERQDSSTAQVRQNAAAIVAGLLKGGVREDIVLRLLDFTDCSLRGVVLRRAVLDACSFVGTDLVGFVAEDSLARGVVFDGVYMSSDTRLDLAGLEVAAFRSINWRRDDRVTEPLYGPNERRSVLDLCGLPNARQEIPTWPVKRDAVETMQKLARVYLNTNIFTEDDRAPEVRRLVQMPSWPGVRDVLLDDGLLIAETRQASGRKLFFRLEVSTADLVAGQEQNANVPARVRAVWENLAEKMPE
jgi:hypothetical protein